MSDVSAVPLVGAIPALLEAAESAVSRDFPGMVVDLGVGGVLVGFAIWLQDRLSRQHRADQAALLAQFEQEKAALLTQFERERQAHLDAVQQFLEHMESHH